MMRRKKFWSVRTLLLVGLLIAGGVVSVATSSRRSTMVVSNPVATVHLDNPFPTGVFTRIVGPVVRLYYMPAHTRRTVVLPAGSYRLYWRRPSYMQFYRYYRLYYFSPGSVTRWKVGMI